MCELTEVTYMPGDVVWVKLGNCWWPGEVKDNESLPEEIMANLRKKPIAVVKFFGEDSYEYVKNLENIYHYNNRRKMEFIKKGMDITRAKSKQGSNVMDKFPTDVVTAESLTGGDINILSTDAFMPKERPQYKDLFGSPSKKKSPKKNGVGRPSTDSKFSTERKTSQSLLGKVNSLIQIKQRITHPRFIKESDHEVRIRQQPKSPAKETEVVTHAYQCKECSFGTSRQNVFILHTKAHLNNVIKPQTPSSSTSKTPGSKSKRGTKTASTVKPSSAKSPAVKPVVEVEKKVTPKTPKESAARRKIFQTSKKGKKSVATPSSTPTASTPKSTEMKERDLEKRNRILADWDDEDMEEEEKEVKKIKLELDKKENEVEKPKVEKPRGKIINKNPPVEKVVSKSSVTESSVYDLIDDAEEIVPPPRISESKRLLAENPPPESSDTQELDKEVAELLEETAMPELPEVPTFHMKESTKHDIPNEPDETSHEPEENTENEQHLDEVNGILKDNNLPVAESVPSEVFTVPASTLSTVTSPSASKTNGTTTTESTIMQSNEVVVDPNSETATYVLVTIDDSGGFQQFQTIEGMGNTLLAYDSSQGEEGGTRTLYIDPSQLGGSAAGLENLFLAIDASDGSGTSMVQIQPQQVTLQVDGSEQSTVTSEELSKSKQDILAVALANTQVLQPSPLEIHGQEAVVKVTNAAQSPVMTPRVTETKIIPQTQNSDSSSVVDNITGGIR